MSECTFTSFASLLPLAHIINNIINSKRYFRLYLASSRLVALMPTLLRRTLEAKARRGVEELSAQLLGSLESPSESVRLVQLIKNQAIGSARHKRWFIECQIVPVLVSLLEYDQAATTAATATASSSLEQQQPQQQPSRGEIQLQAASCIGALASGGPTEAAAVVAANALPGLLRVASGDDTLAALAAARALKAVFRYPANAWTFLYEVRVGYL